MLTNTTDNYTCDCSLPFQGKYCSIDSCLLDPLLLGCKNGGVCYLYSTTTPRCKCAPGFIGRDCRLHICDLEIGPCPTVYKQCVRTTLGTGYTCDCTILFTNPPACNVASGIPASCSPENPCDNQGTCTAVTAVGYSPLPFKCTCTNAYKGTVCETLKTRCEAAGYPCLNQGICNNTAEAPICTCFNGFNNTYCQDDIRAPEIICANKTVTEQGLYQYYVNLISDYGIEINDQRGFYSIWKPAPPLSIPIGKTSFLVKAVDDSGNFAQCSFYIKVVDTIPPNLTCPRNTKFTTMPGEGSTSIRLPRPESVDNYSNVSIDVNLNDSQTISQGNYEVLVTASDNDGNSNNCTYGVHVEEPRILYIVFSVNETFVEAYADTTHPNFTKFAGRIKHAMRTEMSVTSFRHAFSGTMVHALRSGSVEVETAVLLNSNANISDPNVVTNFTNTVNTSINDDGMLGNMSIVMGSLSVSVDVCILSVCNNDGVCLGGTIVTATCNCTNTGYVGQLCDQKVDYCTTTVCENDGTCVSERLKARCDCTVDFTGDTCSVTVDHCAGSPCQNNGVCTSGTNGMYSCECTVDYDGDNCQNVADHCSSTPCQNKGNCISGSNGAFTCECTVDYTGDTCNVLVDHCAGTPCQNGGICSSGTDGEYSCSCLKAFTGDNCQTEVDLCADTPCLNGGNCTSETNGYVCACTVDFTGSNCEETVDHCAQPPCENGGICSLIEGGGFTCECTVDYSGDICQTPVDHCADQPCQNDGACISNTGGKFTCTCASDFTGDTCSEAVDPCNSNPCQNGGTCASSGTNYNCTCGSEFEGATCQTPVDHCNPNPCENGGICVPAVNGFTCSCQRPGTVGDTCEVDLCNPSPCVNGECIGVTGDFSCNCSTDFMGNLCNVTKPCSSNPCQNDGVCIMINSDYQCNCTYPWGGQNCVIDTNPCRSVPCENKGTCVENSETGGYNCTCDGEKWSGTNCEIDLHPCNKVPCQNNGTCVEYAAPGSYNCTCDEVNWTGTRCDIDLTPCNPLPCLNGGNCTSGSDPGVFSCQCDEVEWTGPTCDLDLTPCDPLPCLNGGNCTKESAGYFSCQCDEVDWTGPICELDYSPCTPMPCQNEANCTELDAANYTCDCTAKWTGQNCDIDLVPCKSSPCQNGGTCQNGTTPGVFLCSCADDWIGFNCTTLSKTCKTNPCQNGGTCTPSAKGPTCQCTADFEGTRCSKSKDKVNECNSNPCKNGGTCLNLVGNYACTCPDGYAGTKCETNNVDAGSLEGEAAASWWIIVICICFLAIIGISAGLVFVSMSKKSSAVRNK